MRMLGMFFAIVGLATADLVKLKDGTVVIGDILEETPLEIRIETETAGGTIVRTERISKNDILEIQRWTPAQKQEHAAAREFEKAQRYQLSPQTSLTVAAYDRVIEGVLRKFLTEHPHSVHAPAIQAQLRAWQSERDRVAAGEVKMDGQWISREEFDRQKTAEQIRTLSRQGEQAMQERRWSQAAAAYESLIALKPTGATLDIARRQLAVALVEWRRSLEEFLEQLRTRLTAAQQRVEKARQAHHEAQAQVRDLQARANRPREDGKLGALGGELTRAQSALVAATTELRLAEEALAPLRSQAEAAQRQLADIQQRIARNQIQAEVAAATPPSPQDTVAGAPTASAVSRPPPPSGSTDVLEDTASWWSQNWIWLAAAALLGLFLLSRLMR